VFQKYYRDPTDANNDFCNDTVFLQVNCTGKERHTHCIKADTKRNDWYLYYLVKGNVKVTMPFNDDLCAGDMVVFSADTPFAYDDQDVTEHYFVHFTGFAAADVMRQAGIASDTRYSINDGARVQAAFAALFASFLNRDALFDMRTATKLMSLLAKCAEDITKAQDAPHGATAGLQRSLQFIHEHFRETVDVRELAKMEHVSVSYYRRSFVTVMRRSPMDYVIGLRMNLACQLLESTTMSIGEIAEAVGYEDQRYFTRLFHKRHGVTPRQYRSDI